MLVAADSSTLTRCGQCAAIVHAVTVFNAAPGGGTSNAVNFTVTAGQKLLTGITRSRLADGKIVESWTEWNRVQAFHDLGGVG